MKKMIGLALLATTALAGTASAEVSGNVALTTDYVFRGISQSGSDAAVSGGFDWTQDALYAGVWGSSINFGNGTEVDAYAGWRPSIGPVALDLGVVGYFYPGASDEGQELDFYELQAGATFSPVESLTLGGLLAFSPDYTGERSDALYIEANAAYAFSDVLSVSGAYGNQDIDDVDGSASAASIGDDYSTWNVGATYATHGFGLDLRYHDTDIDAGDDIEAFSGTTKSVYEEAFVFTVSRAL